MTSKPRPEPVVLELEGSDLELYEPAAILVERPSGRAGSGSAIIEIKDASGRVLGKTLSNGIPLCRATIPLLVEPRGLGYRGLPPAREN